MSDRAMGFMCHTGDLGWEELIAWVQEGEQLALAIDCAVARVPFVNFPYV